MRGQGIIHRWQRETKIHQTHKNTTNLAGDRERGWEGRKAGRREGKWEGRQQTEGLAAGVSCLVTLFTSRRNTLPGNKTLNWALSPPFLAYCVSPTFPSIPCLLLVSLTSPFIPCLLRASSTSSLFSPHATRPTDTKDNKPRWKGNIVGGKIPDTCTTSLKTWWNYDFTTSCI